MSTRKSEETAFSLESALATIEKLSTIEVIGDPQAYRSGCFTNRSTKDVLYASGDLRNGSLLGNGQWSVPLKPSSSDDDGIIVCPLESLQNVRVILGGIVYAFFGHPDSCDVGTEIEPNPEVDNDNQKFLVFVLQEKVRLDSIVHNWPKDRQDLHIDFERSELASQLWAEEGTLPPKNKTVSLTFL